MKTFGLLVTLFTLISSVHADVPKWEASTGFPQILRAGKYGYQIGEFEGYWNAGFMKFGISRIGLESYGIEVGIRTPVYKKIYASLSAGWMSFTGAVDLSSIAIETGPVASTVSAQLLGFYFMPAIGGRFPISDSLEYGFDIGLQIPVLAWGFMASDWITTSVTQGATIQRLAYLPVPHITLVRISWR
ncbi:MAG: hypothetical protein KA715_03725 [Xanthomonadaceae bacterium]|nr:hypothetical protein [Xanthomonadaceae bacterium]